MKLADWSLIVFAIIAVALLSGCGSGYSVQVVNEKRCTDEQAIFYFKCTKVNGLFWVDNVIAVCQDREECNKLCAEERTK